MDRDPIIEGLIEAVSAQAGAVDAMEAVVMGLLGALRDHPDVQAGVGAELFRVDACLNGSNTNPLRSEQFELSLREMASRLRSARPSISSHYPAFGSVAAPSEAAYGGLLVKG